MTSSLPAMCRSRVLEEAHYVGAAQGVIAHLQQHAPGRRDGADQSQVVTGERHAQDGHLAAPSVGADDRRQQVAAGLVYEDDGAPFGGRLA